MNTALIVGILNSIILVIVAAPITYLRVKKHKRTNLSDWLVCAFILYAGICCAYLFTLALTSDTSPLRRIPNAEVIQLYPMYALLAIIGIWIGSAIIGTNKIIINAGPASTRLKNTYEKKFIITAWLLLSLAVASYWLYARAYGGFDNLLSVSIALRSALFDEVSSNPWSFLKRFGGFSFFSSLIFAGLILSKKSLFRAPILLYLGFALSFFFSLFVLYSWRGRLGLLSYFLSFIIAYIFKKNGFGIKSISIISIVVLLLISLMPLSDLIWYKDRQASNVSHYIQSETTFPLSNFVAVNKENEYRWMKDIIISPIFILPQRFWSGILRIETASEINTERIVGFKKGKYGQTKGVPADFITFGMMQLGVIGVILTGIISGILLTLLDNWLIRQFPNGIREAIYAYAILFIPSFSVLYCDPNHITERNFHFIAGVVLIRLFINLAKNSKARKLQVKPKL